jgi:ectoine hydroxylase-related dioxygenase (phytanoyl-CoA dioxygenase family)
MHQSMPQESIRPPADGAWPAARDAVDAATVAAYQRDGCVVIRQALTRDDLAVLERGIEANLASPGALSAVASAADDPGRFIEDFCNWQRIAEYEFILKQSALPAIAAALTGSRTVRLYHDHLLGKEAGTRQPTPWHQDQPYYNVDGRQNVSFWIPVDPVSRASTLEFLAGSHRGPWLMPRTFLTQQAKWFPEGSLTEMPDMNAAEQRERVVGWALEPGDCVAFHMLTLHAAAGVEPGRRRRVFSARYLGDDIVHAPRAWRTSPEFDGLRDELPSGAPLAHPLFPLVWPPPS